jgi:hypothetical protein
MERMRIGEQPVPKTGTGEISWEFEPPSLRLWYTTNMKRCSRCKEEKSDSDFHWKIPGKSLHHACKPCQNLYTAEHYKKNKQYYKDKAKRRSKEASAMVAQAKARPCIDCGIEYPPHVMDFDHLYDKEFNIAHMPNRGFSLKRIQEEMNKCEVVCANCHRQRTHARKV